MALAKTVICREPIISMEVQKPTRVKGLPSNAWKPLEYLPRLIAFRTIF
jgi:hypothetical protein